MKPLRWLAEMIWSPALNTLRSGWRGVETTFWGSRPALDKTTVTFEAARQLYRNDSADTVLGGGFCRPIVDLAVSFMQLPVASHDDEQLVNYLNDCFHVYWPAQLQEVFRNALRDSKTFVRMDQPRTTNPLVSEDERMHMKIRTLEPERCKLLYAPDDPCWVARAYINHWVEMEDEVNQDVTDPRQKPKIKEHEIIEIIDPEGYRYYDKTENVWLDSWATGNPYGFVPVLEVWNEYDSSLSGGQSEYEGPLPFIRAFHEVLLQGLQAHRYHSTPKVKIRVKNIVTFLRNNFPEVLDNNGVVKAQSTLNWKGREAIIFEADEDADFLEARSVLGDTKTLLEFLIDCISIASETPEWAFMRVEEGTSQGAMNAQTLPFERKIQRKRIMFTPYIQQLAKMALVMSNREPETIQVIWPQIRPETLIQVAQAFQQLLMGIDVARNAKLMSDDTAMKIISRFVPEMKSPGQERQDAEENYLPELELQQQQMKQQEETAKRDHEVAKIAARNPPAQPDRNGSGPPAGGRTTTASNRS